jgi:hypothetical protein
MVPDVDARQPFLVEAAIDHNLEEMHFRPIEDIFDSVPDLQVVLWGILDGRDIVCHQPRYELLCGVVFPTVNLRRVGEVDVRNAEAGSSILDRYIVERKG